uniref:Nucleotide-diphospho-sugar transferase domain-containing protein n=1 Tax=Rhodosorus marinus TaxID=101924 RepID=A0A6T6LCG5_9RHOD|mmetsp:Transcript_1719/g.2634  ORF Transcript_1719/g.2634 Transcript_1719/m.2634 type:complete len:385 (+) Transcript_1719:193-1347(+)
MRVFRGRILLGFFYLWLVKVCLGEIPVFFVHYGLCFPPFSIELAAMMAKEVYYVGEPGCDLSTPRDSVIHEKNIHYYFGQEAKEVDRLYPAANSPEKGKMTEEQRFYEVKCIQRYFIMRDLMVEHNLDRIMHLDADIMLYIQPDVLFEKIVAEAKFVPDIVLSTEVHSKAPAYVSMWSLDGITAICKFMLQTLRNNRKYYFNDMLLTSLYYEKSVGSKVNFNLDGAATPSAVAIIRDLPSREYGLNLREFHFPLIFDWKFHGKETTFLLLPEEPHPRDPDMPVIGKRVFFCKSIPLLYDLRTQQFAAVGTLHMRGPMKDNCEFYRPWILEMPCVCNDLLCLECLGTAEFRKEMPEIGQLFEEECSAMSTSIEKEDEEEFESELY